MAIDIYGAIGPGFERGVHLFAEYIASKKGTCPVRERRDLVAQLSSLVQQRTAVSVNRRRLNFHALT